MERATNTPSPRRSCGVPLLTSMYLALIILNINMNDAEFPTPRTGNVRCRKKTQLVTLL